MKRGKKMLLIWAFIVLVILIALRPLIATATAGLLAPPIPTPILGNGPNIGQTATPDQTQVAKNLLVTPDFIAPTPTKIIIAKTTDLDPELGSYDKYIFIIAHPDGTNEKVLFGPIPPGDMSLHVPEAVLQKLHLQPGDKIISRTNLRGFTGGGPTMAPTLIQTFSETAVQEIKPTATMPAYP